MAGSVGQYTVGFFPFVGAKADLGARRFNDSGYLAMGFWISTNQSDYSQWDIYWDSVTWKYAQVYNIATDSGICTVKKGATTLGTIDHYGAGTNNAYAEITSIAVATAGIDTLEVSDPTKNASASNYYIRLQSIALIRTGGTPSTPGGTDTPGYTHEWVAFMGEKASVGSVTRSQFSGLFAGGYTDAGTAQNNERTYDWWRDTGTYTSAAMVTKDADCGILDAQWDGSSKGTIDTYAAATSYNNFATITSITSAAAAVTTFKALGGTKNASSSAYRLYLHTIKHLRTGA